MMTSPFGLLVLPSVQAAYRIVHHLQQNKSLFWAIVCIACFLVYAKPNKAKVVDEFSNTTSLNGTDETAIKDPQPQETQQNEEDKEITTASRAHQGSTGKLRSFVDILESGSFICKMCCQGAIESMKQVNIASSPLAHLALTDSENALVENRDSASKFKVAKRLRRMGLDIIIEECEHTEPDTSTDPKELYVPSTPFRYPFSFTQQLWQAWQPNNV